MDRQRNFQVVFETGADTMIVLLHNIRSLHNVGSIFRTADAVGIKKIYLCGYTPAPVDDFGRPRKDLTKVSLGAEKTVAWDASARSTQATLKLIEKLKKEGYKIFAVEQAKNSTPYYKLRTKKQEKIVLILGSEVGGLPKSILKKSDKVLEIPMRGALVKEKGHPRRTRRGKESLNVAVAFGVVAFYLTYLR